MHPGKKPTLCPPSGGTDGGGSGCRDTWQYTETSRLLGREEHRRCFLNLPLLTEDAVLSAKPLILAQKLGVLHRLLGFLENRPNPFDER